MRYILFIKLTYSWYYSPHNPRLKGGQQALNSFLNQHIIYPEFAEKLHCRYYTGGSG